MSEPIKLLTPIGPAQLSKQHYSGLKGLAETIAREAVLQYSFSQMLVIVYITGLYHGAELANRAMAKDEQ